MRMNRKKHFLRKEKLFAYVTNFGDDTISIIDTKNDKVTGTILVREQPDGITISPLLKHAYVSNTNHDSVSVIDLSSH